MAGTSPSISTDTAAQAPRPRDQSLDMLKGLAILGVLLAHMGSGDRFDGLLGLLQFLLGWCVTAFFYASGAVTRLPNSDPLAYVLGRAKRLLIPFAIFAVGGNILVVSGVMAGAIYNPEIASKGWPAVWAAIYSPQLYFLPLLFVVSSTWALLNQRINTTTRTLIVFALIPWVWIHSYEGTGYGNYLFLYPIYIAAFVIAQASPTQRRYLSIPLLVSGFAELVLRGQFYSGHIAVVIWLGVAFEQPWARRILPLKWLGVASGAIFLWHCPVILPLISKLSGRLMPAVAQSLGFLIALVVTTSLASFAVDRLVKRFPIGRQITL